jgi:hypothetical protein
VGDPDELAKELAELAAIKQAAINTRVNDAISWDDRKDLAWRWQLKCDLPATGLSDEFYSALLDIAIWGAKRLISREEN